MLSVVILLRRERNLCSRIGSASLDSSPSFIHVVLSQDLEYGD